MAGTMKIIMAGTMKILMAVYLWLAVSTAMVVAEFYWVVLVGGGDVEKHVQGLEIVEDRA